MLANAPFVFAVCSLRTPKGARQVAYEPERAGFRVDAPGKTRCDFLQQPGVAVYVTERGERAVGGVIGCWPTDTPALPIRLELIAWPLDVEHLADFCTASDKFLAGSLDV